MTKRIGILSFANVINHGAYLQIYGLYRFLRKENHIVKVINYRNKDHLLNEYRALFIKKNFSEILTNFKRYRTFKLAQKRFKLMHQFTNPKLIKKINLDMIIIGADVVWNYKSPYFGNDLTYFGKEINNRKLISYAPSMGDCSTKDPIPKYAEENLLNNFSNISVRDRNSANILENYNINSKIVLDPTLIYDFSEDEILPSFNEEFILIYAFNVPDKDINELLSLSKKYSMKLISLGFNKKYDWCDSNIMCLDPLEFLGYFKKANYVYTSTFHGILFCIKYLKYFAIRMNGTIENKAMFILEELKIKDQIITESIELSFENKINFAFMKYKLDELIKESSNFLKNSIND